MVIELYHRLLKETKGKGMASLAKKARDWGYTVAPCGDGDAKTASPGTYRQVGATCPSTCPYLNNGCYAQSGNVALHQRRGGGALASANAAAICAVNAKRTGRKVRLHISGDFLKANGRIDWDYVELLQNLSFAIGSHWAWTYTHIEDPRLVSALRTALPFVTIRHSGSDQAMGAVVRPFGKVDSMRESGVKTLKCPAQLSKTDCNKCRACWERPDHTIVFDPHGSSKRKVLAVVG